MKIINKIIEYVYSVLFPKMELNERIKIWCNSLSKNISYGDDMTSEKLDKLKFPNRKLRFYKKIIIF